MQRSLLADVLGLTSVAVIADTALQRAIIQGNVAVPELTLIILMKLPSQAVSAYLCRKRCTLYILAGRRRWSFL